MKTRNTSESSFFAKMLLLFALVFMGHHEKRKGLEDFFMGAFSSDSAKVGQIQTTRLLTSGNIQSSMPR